MRGGAGLSASARASRPPYSASRGIHSNVAGVRNAWDHPPGAARDARHGRRDAHPTRDTPSRYLSVYLCKMVSRKGREGRKGNLLSSLRDLRDLCVRLSPMRGHLFYRACWRWNAHWGTSACECRKTFDAPCPKWESGVKPPQSKASRHARAATRTGRFHRHVANDAASSLGGIFPL